MRATNRLKTNKQKSQSVHAKEVAPQCSDLHISLTRKSQVWSWEETEFPLGLRQEGHPTFKKKKSAKWNMRSSPLWWPLVNNGAAKRFFSE